MQFRVPGVGTLRLFRGPRLCARINNNEIMQHQKERTRQGGESALPTTPQRTCEAFEIRDCRFQSRARRALFPEVLIEEIRGGVIGGEPGAMPQEIVNLVGEDELLEFHLLFPQRLHQADHFREGHVPVIIPLHEQHG